MICAELVVTVDFLQNMCEKSEWLSLATSRLVFIYWGEGNKTMINQSNPSNVFSLPFCCRSLTLKSSIICWKLLKAMPRKGKELSATSPVTLSASWALPGIPWRVRIPPPPSLSTIREVPSLPVQREFFGFNLCAVFFSSSSDHS